MEIHDRSSNNFDWISPKDIQKIIDADEKLVQSMLKNCESPQIVTAFFTAISDPKWVQKHPDKCLKAIKLMPKEWYVSEEKTAFKAAATAGFIQLGGEVLELTKTLCAKKKWESVLEWLPLVGNPIVNAYGDTVLHLISAAGTPKQVAAACNIILNSGLDLDQKNKMGDAPLHVAVQNDRAEIVQVLGDSNADLEVQNSMGQTPLLLASETERKEICFKLIDLEANIHAQDNLGNQPLHYACSTGQTSLVLVLTELEANIDAVTAEGKTPLYLAAGNDHTEIVNKLIAKDAKIDLADEDGITPLSVAIQNLHLTSAHELILQGADIHAVTTQGDTPLHHAVAAGNIEMTHLLVASGAHINAKNNQTWTPLHFAAQKGDIQLIQSLKLGADPNQAGLDGMTPLHLACCNSHLKAVHELLQLGAAIDSKTTSDGSTALHHALLSRDTEIASLLIASGADIGAQTIMGQTPLHIASLTGNTNMVAKLITMGANLESKDRYGNTSLYLACQTAELETVLTLLDNNPLIETTNIAGYTPLHTACWNGHPLIVSQLIASRADIHVKAKDGQTPLHLAVKNNKPEIVQQLLNLDAGLEERDIDGNTPFLTACQKSNLDTISLLIQSGANLTAKNNEGLTAMHFAAMRGHTTIVNKLLEHSVSLHTKSNDGRTPLHLAAMYGQTEIVKRLIQQGAKLETRDHLGYTPLNLASQAENKETVDQLILLKAKFLGDANGFTPLQTACWQNDTEAMDALIQKGADLNERSANGETPLLLAIRRNNIEAIQKLLKLGADTTTFSSNTTTLYLSAITSITNPELINQLAAADKGLSFEYLSRKILSHRMGLGKKSVLANQMLNHSGLYIDTAKEYLQLGTSSYYDQIVKALTTADDAVWKEVQAKLSPSSLKQLERLQPQAIVDILESTTNAINKSLLTDITEIKERHSQGFAIGLSNTVNTSEGPHAVSMAIYGDKIARCNRGQGCGKEPGVIIHTITNPDKLVSSLKKCTPTTTIDYFHKGGMESELDLHDKIYISQQYQKVSNCAVASSNSMELALLYLQFEPLIGHQAAKELARAIKSGRTIDSREQSVEDYLSYHEQDRHYPPDLTLLGNIYKKCSTNSPMHLRVREQILNWADRRKIAPSKIIFDEEWH